MIRRRGHDCVMTSCYDLLCHQKGGFTSLIRFDSKVKNHVFICKMIEVYKGSILNELLH